MSQVNQNQTENNENTTTVQASKATSMKDKNSILNNFKGEFASSFIPIYINSLKREVKFREVSVKEQKSLSKTMIQNESRKDIIYDTQCALINELCLEDDFDVYKLTEFDRIRILMEIYSVNYIQNEVEFKCPECGMVNKYKIDFSKITSKMNDFDLVDKTFSVEDKVRVYNFTLNYPSVYNVSEFYRDYLKQYKDATQKEREMLDNLGNIEYINLFVKEIEIINKTTGNKQSADMTMMSLHEIEQLFELFPQNIIFDDKTGVLQHITKEFIEKISGIFEYEKCAKCGHKTQQGIGDLADFF